jgi:hypothetical protein
MIYLASADTGVLPLNSSPSWQMLATQVRTGSNSYYIASASSSTALNFGFQQFTPTEVYFRVAIYSIDENYTAFFARFRTYNNVSVGPYLYVGTDDSFDVLIGNAGTVLETLPGALLLNVWQVWELKATATTVEVRLDGATVYSGTGLTISLADIANFAVSGSSALQLWKGHVDDVMVTDQGWPGLGGVHVFTPTGAGIHQDWTGSLPALTTDAAVAGTKQTYTKDALSANALNVTAANVQVVSKVNGQGYGAVSPILGADVASASALSVSERLVEYTWDGPWTPAEFDALEFGVASA